MTRASSGRLAVAPDLHDRLVALETRAAVAPKGPADALEVVESLLGAAGDLAGAPVTRKKAVDAIEATRRSGHVVALGPDLAVTAVLDDADRVRTARLAVADASWQVDAGSDQRERRLRVSVKGDIVADWTWTPDGEVVDNGDLDALWDAGAAAMAAAMQAELPDLGPITPVDEQEIDEPEVEKAPPAQGSTAWAPTHQVGGEPLVVGAVPTGTLEPGTVLAAGLEVRHVETTTEGWALVECSNGWRCYVDARGLRPIGRATTFAVTRPVEAKTARGDPIWLVPGERYALGEESGGWVASEVDGTPVWVPTWAARPG